jgi:hypothetical protein
MCNSLTIHHVKKHDVRDELLESYATRRTSKRGKKPISKLLKARTLFCTPIRTYRFYELSFSRGNLQIADKVLPPGRPE